jgi:hypothetical protein
MSKVAKTARGAILAGTNGRPVLDWQAEQDQIREARMALVGALVEAFNASQHYADREGWYSTINAAMHDQTFDRYDPIEELYEQIMQVISRGHTSKHIVEAVETAIANYVAIR